MDRHTRCALWLAVCLSALLPAGCTSISIEPSCPDALRVGESGIVAAHEENPGEIAQYVWEVLPSDAGTVEDPDQPQTTFTALQEGTVVLRLTASDGIYQVQSQCTTLITALTLTVTLEATPDAAEVGETVLLTCASVGPTEAAEFIFTQTGGEPVELTDFLPGVAAFVPEQAGELSFECVGADAAGVTGLPGSVSVSITEAADGGGRDGGRDPRNPR